MLTSEFCEEFINTCDGQIPFPTYDDGESYCEKHTGAIDWAYPYVEGGHFQILVHIKYDTAEMTGPVPQCWSEGLIHGHFGL